jgi:hypothetical protein
MLSRWLAVTSPSAQLGARLSAVHRKIDTWTRSYQ